MMFFAKLEEIVAKPIKKPYFCNPYKKIKIMLQSMTGFGRASGAYKEKNITVEVRSLNSKVFDLRFKVPLNFKEKELEIRRLVSSMVERGKIDGVVSIQSSSEEDGGTSINKPLFKKYYKEINGLSKELGIAENGDVVQAILRLPNVILSDESEIDEEEWAVIERTVRQAMEQFVAFREQEGESMSVALLSHTANILDHLTQIKPFEDERIDKVRQRMYANLEEFLGKENVDKNRYEQEILFYLEKIDITEEKVRLEQHCNYFQDELVNNKNTAAKGRTLSFISQEMGREINTLGAKAYSSEIQRFVVKMKDELEKIKEILANIA
jgi:uncharacterized protein (TIGR00255 family)